MDEFQNLHFQDLGEVGYQSAWDYQENLVAQNLAQKKQLSKLTKHTLIFCTHPHVYTLGKSGHENHLLANASFLKTIGATFVKTNRGGDITYHGPGQVVGYPILDLEKIFTDLGKYMRSLEEVIIRTIAEYGILGDRLKGSTGVWLDVGKPAMERKICAMGVRCSRWVTMHGFALNVNTDLSYFNHIVPCGIVDKGVTSLKKELNREVDMEEVKQKLKYHFSKVFNLDFFPQKENEQIMY